MNKREYAAKMVAKYQLTTETDKQYTAAREMSAELDIPHGTAMTEINRCLWRIEKGLDPVKDARGGRRDGAGRKAKSPQKA